MSKPKESLIQYLWMQKKIPGRGLCTTSGKKLEIIHYGQINTLGGPDIFQAKLRIDETLWVGNVEFHVNGSDWYKHNHDTDSAYNNVILHVVLNDDRQVAVKNEMIETFVVPPSLVNYHSEKFSPFLSSNFESGLPCASALNEIPEFHLESWKLRLLIDRWEDKLKDNAPKTDVFNYCWSMIMVTFGVKYNKIPMRMIANSINFKELVNLSSHELDNLFLKLSQLEMPISIEENQNMQMEIPVEINTKQIKLEWKFGGIRPANQPIIKLMQFSSFFYLAKDKLVDAMLNLDFKSILRITEEVKIHSYWETHSAYNKQCKERKLNLGRSFQNHLKINALYPLAFHLNKNLNGLDISEKILDNYRNSLKETNRILSFMEQNGFENRNGMDSQSLLQLYNNYCQSKNCLNCGIGAKILK
ncbi:MAG: DUF2851 family protein [Crocinitomicaceae bacterium]|nr:DUF2851 family protein [Crocinitomicaceae bacterium]